MSVINKMLQDLDRRNALSGSEAHPAAQNVKVVDASHPGREWFWRVIAALLLAAVVWVGWVAYQLQPRTLATERAFRAAEQARTGSIVAVQPAPPPPAVVPVQAPPAPVAELRPEPAESFKLARAIETPIAERKAAAPAKPAVPAKAPPVKEVRGTVDKRDTTRTARDVADLQFRRAAQFLNQGRVSEAEAQLAEALKTDPAHARARQAYVALLLEQRRLQEAGEALRAALAANPSHAAFVLALARIHVEQRDYAAALAVLDHAGPAVQSPDFHGLRAVVLQRVGRHAEAVAAYQQALASGPQSPATWMGLAISLEALGHRPEAAQAYKRALGAGALAPEAKEYAEARVKALD